MTIVNAGVYYGYSAAFTPNSGQQDAFITVELTDVRKHSSQYYAKMIRERMQKEFSGIEVSFQLGGLLSSSLNSGLPAPIDIQVGGPSLERAHDLAQTLVEIVKKVQGAVDVRLRQRLDAPQMMLEIDRRKASDLGLTADLVVKNVVSAVSNSSSYSPAVWVDPKTGIDYSFGVQYRRDEIQNFDDVLKIPIVSPDQERSVPLRMVASTRIQHNGPTEINHKNLQPVVDIFVDSQGRDIGSVASDVKAILETVTNQWPKDYWYDVRGEITEMRRSLQSLTFGLVLAALFVYLVLVTQFRSFLYPAIIMTTVPMGLVGVVIVMTVWPTYFSIQSAIGCIFVVGVAVSHGVLLLESMLEFYHQSGSLHESIIRGAYTRFRPITMTSLASIFALIPMACGMGLGSEANVPLGRAVIGGQVLSTLLNFFVVPCLFYVLQSRRERRQAMHNSSAANSTATESQAA
jgi:multidrug efflux pump subunit AcrB